MIDKILKMFGYGAKEAFERRELAQIRKVQESQNALLHAATSTADAAQIVTGILRERLDDSLRQLDVTSKLLSDSLILCSHDGTIESVNPISEHMYDWASEELIGQNIVLLFRGADGALLDLESIINAFAANVNQPNPLLETPMEYMRGKKKNGKLFWVDGDVTIIDRLDGSKKVMILSRDVTMRVDIQRELEQNELRYRSIFETSWDAILVVQNHYIIAANPAIDRILGFTADEMMAQPLDMLMATDYKVKLSDFHSTRMNGNLAFMSAAVKCIHKSGHEVDVLWTSSPLYWDGKPGSLITIRDISEFKSLGGNVDALINVKPRYL